jgi:regulator of protease activity HflC (stomatin/prohibitin superfamily)
MLVLVLCGFAAVTAVTVVILVCFSWVSVTHGYTAIAELQGQYSRTLTPGWHWILWPMETLRSYSWSYQVENENGRGIHTEVFSGSHIFMGLRVYDFPPVSVWSSDRQVVNVNGYVDYKISEAKVALYGSDNPLHAMQLLISTSLRNAISEMKYEAAISAQVHLRKSLMTDCNHQLVPRGIEIVDVRIQSIMPSQSIIESNERAIAARREAEAHAILESTRRDAQIMSAKTEAEVKYTQLASELKRNEDMARSYATCTLARADADAQAEKKRAEGRRAYAEAVGPQFMAAEAYAGALRKIGGRAGSSTLILPYDAAQAMGGLNVAQTVFAAGVHRREQTTG